MKSSPQPPRSHLAALDQRVPCHLRRLLGSRAPAAPSARRPRGCRPARAATRRRSSGSTARGFSECCVLGLPSGLEHVIGVAVVGRDQGTRRRSRAPAATTSPRHASPSRSLHRRGNHAVCPTMSAFAKLMNPEARLILAPRPTNAAAASARSSAACGHRSARSRGEATSSPALARHRRLLAAVEKYVTCAYFSSPPRCSCDAPARSSTVESVQSGCCGENTTG